MSPKSRIIIASVVVAGALASQFEGYRAKPYIDPVGIVTVCEGHTGRDIVPGRQYTPAECAEFKRKDLLAASAVVDSCIVGALTVNQRAALVDFAFNVGPGRPGVKDGLCWLKNGQRPTIMRLFNSGQYRAGCDEYLKWNRNKLNGITRRREAERNLCLS